MIKQNELLYFSPSQYPPLTDTQAFQAAVDAAHDPIVDAPGKTLYIRVGSPNKSDNCPVALRNPVWLEVSHES